MRRATLIFTMLLCTLCVYGQSDKITAQKQVIANLQKQIAAGAKEVASLRQDRTKTEASVRTLATQIETRNRLLTAQNAQVELLKEAIDQSDEKHGALNSELEEEKRKYREMVREAYRNYQHNDLMSYLFTSQSFIDVATKIVNIRAVSKLREERMAKIAGLTDEVLIQRQLLADNKAELDATVRELELQKESLVKDQKSARSSIASLSAKEKKRLQENELQQRKLDSAISELRNLTKGNTTGASFTAKTSNLNLPVVGGRVKRYIDNMAEVLGAANSRVVSIYEGKVVEVKQNRITGKYDVYIAHGEYITSYAGLSNVSVAKLSNVSKNQTIGVIGEAVDILTMQSEYKIVFGIYPPNANQKLKAADCFKK